MKPSEDFSDTIQKLTDSMRQARLMIVLFSVCIAWGIELSTFNILDEVPNLFLMMIVNGFYLVLQTFLIVKIRRFYRTTASAITSIAQLDAAFEAGNDSAIEHHYDQAVAALRDV